MNGSDALYKKLKIAEIINVRDDFRIFVFKDGHHISYSAGQYLTLVLMSNGKEVRRSYSLTSSPALHERLSIGVRRVPNGLVSRQLIDYAKPGDEILTIGAGGFFILPNNIAKYRKIYFFAAGSGITPCFSLIKTIMVNEPELCVQLVYSNSSPETTVFRNELIELQNDNPERFKTEFLYSSSRNLAKARLHRELLIELVEKNATAKFSETLYYICGPAVYSEMCTFTLQSIGVPKENIKKEDFIVEGPIINRIKSPDQESHNVRFHLGEKTVDLTVNYPDSILQSAKKNGINLPYSCESGRCGNCVARCISGKVWHSYNEVLTDRELEQGLILTCVGHPIFGDVELLV